MNFMNVIFAAQKQVKSLIFHVFSVLFMSFNLYVSLFYINLFCILKQNILIDACVLDSDSGLLQQVHFYRFL